MPDDLDDPQSPIDGLKKFDWGSADQELNDFLGESGDEDEDGDESDTGSIASGKICLPVKRLKLMNVQGQAITAEKAISVCVVARNIQDQSPKMMRLTRKASWRRSSVYRVLGPLV
jgi:hypothetical protein